MYPPTQQTTHTHTHMYPSTHIPTHPYTRINHIPTHPTTYIPTHPPIHTHTHKHRHVPINPYTHPPTPTHQPYTHPPNHTHTNPPTHPHTHTHTQSIHWGHIMITITVAVETRDWPCCQWPSHISSATSCLSSLPARSWLPATQCLHTELTATAGTASDPQGPYMYKHKQVTVARCGRTPFLIFVSPISNMCVCLWVCTLYACACGACVCV